MTLSFLFWIVYFISVIWLFHSMLVWPFFRLFWTFFNLFIVLDIYLMIDGCYSFLLFPMYAKVELSFIDGDFECVGLIIVEWLWTCFLLELPVLIGLAKMCLPFSKILFDEWDLFWVYSEKNLFFLLTCIRFLLK